MIYTITTNPSLDYYLKFDKPILKGEHNRSIGENYDAGGKGVNVSIFLNELGIQSATLGFLGGFAKDFYLSNFTNYPSIQPLFTTINDNIRINVKTISDCTTSLNAKGPSITNEEFNKFVTRISRIYDTDFVVLSGNIQEELSEKMVDVVKDLTSSSTKVILDTDENITIECLKYKPYVVKLNDQNSGIDEKEIISKAKDYIEKGATYVLYSSPVNCNYYLVYESGVYKTTRDESVAISTGSGDSMIAGFLYSTIRGANPLESFKYSAVCSMNLKLSNELVDRKLIEDKVDKLEVVNL